MIRGIVDLSEEDERRDAELWIDVTRSVPRAWQVSPRWIDCVRRNQAAYLDPSSYDPVTTEESRDAIRVAYDCLASDERLLKLDELGVF